MGKKIQCIGRYVMDSQTLGKGNFARVELATHSVTGCKVAIKIIDTRKIKEEYVRQNLHREARILGQLRHPNIIRLYETLKANTLYCLVMEYAAGGDLLAYIKLHKDFHLPEEKGRGYIRQLISAIHYLHERGVSHRDLKMDNIMLDEKKKNLKIVDFGLSNTFSRDDLMKTHCGSPEYAAPELFTAGEKYGPEVDIWSLGIIMYAAIVGKLPFTTPYTDQYRRQKLQQQIGKGLIEQHEQEMALLSKDCRDLLRRLIEPSPDLRLPLMDIEIHPWVTAGGKMPFFPFHAFPKEKLSKTQVTQELSSLLSMNQAQVEKTVKECKSDDLSAMFNMMLDSKRQEKGIFDADFTIKQEKQKDAKLARPKRLKPKTKHDKEHSKSHSPVLLCPHMTVDHASDVEDHPHHDHAAQAAQAAHSNKVSANFDFMALCSAPTWLGPERRRSRRRTQHAPLSPLQSIDTIRSEDISARTLLENPNLLSPNYSGQPPQSLIRRSSSRSFRRRRPSSCGPPSRRTSFRHRQTSGAVSSQPNSPTLRVELSADHRTRSSSFRHRKPRHPDHSQENSPNDNSPVITIDTPKTVGLLPRPEKLGLTECFTVPPVNISTSDAMPSMHVNGPVAVDIHCSNSSIPCSNTHLPEECSLPLIQTEDKIHLIDAQPSEQEETVESKIASADIRSIVRPKQLLTSNTLSVQLEDGTFPIPTMQHCAVQLSNAESCNNSAQSSKTHLVEKPDESMQTSSYVNLSDDEKIEHCRLLHKGLRTDSEKRIKQGICDLKLFDVGDEFDENVSDAAEHSHVQSEKNSFTSHLKRGSRRSHSDCEDRLDFSISSTPKDMFDLSSSHTTDSNTMALADIPRGFLCDPLLCEQAVCNSDTSPSSDSSGPSETGSNPFHIPRPILQGKFNFRTPLARIESFHSDDFEALTNDLDSACPSPSSPSNSVNTPTVPCFAYRLNTGKRKSLKTKSSKTKGKDHTSEVRVKFSDDDRNHITEKLRCEPPTVEAVLSSDSDGGDKGISSSKAKIHPIDKDELEMTDFSTKDTKLSRTSNKNKNDTVTSLCSDSAHNQPNSKNLQNILNNRTSKCSNTSNHKKTSPWKHSFVQFLKKKRHQNCNIDKSNASDLLTSNQRSRTTNGHAHSPVTKTMSGSVDHEGRDQEGQWTTSNNPVANNIPAPEIREVRSSPDPTQLNSPTTTKVFDFTLVPSSPKGRSCLLSWKGCRDCTFSDEKSSEDEESDSNSLCIESSVSMKPPLTLNSIPDSRNYTTYKLLQS
ncbi:hypothetical protein ScPMuIL_000602 [Solemya velum]